MLGPNAPIIHEFPVLCEASRVECQERLFQVQLFNYNEEFITMIINVANVYVEGFFANNRYHHLGGAFSNVNAYQALFPYTKELNFGDMYDEQEHEARAKKLNLELGHAPLNNAISQLCFMNHVSFIAKSLLLTIQMISKEVRLSAMKRHIASHIDTRTTYVLTILSVDV